MSYWVHPLRTRDVPAIGNGRLCLFPPIEGGIHPPDVSGKWIEAIEILRLAESLPIRRTHVLRIHEPERPEDPESQESRPQRRCDLRLCDR